MKPTNRLHSHTRWPSDPCRRLELAETDLAFCDAIARIMDSLNGLERIWMQARIARTSAEWALSRRN